MIELFRNYWWVSVIIAAFIVVVTHALLVKLIADSEKADAERPAASPGSDPPGQ